MAGMLRHGGLDEGYVLVDVKLSSLGFLLR